MVADFYTKTLQGKHYYKLRNLIMGHDNMPVEERVEENDKKATEQDISPTVSKSKRREITKYGMKVSSNFN